MFHHVKNTRYIENFRIWVLFDDGLEGIVDLELFLKGPVFEPLQKIDYFKKVFVDPQLGTISWPNGADFAPEFLRDKLNCVG